MTTCPEWEGTKLRVTAVISSLRSGGAERVLTLLANAWVERGWRVTILHLGPASEEPFYILDERVARRGLGLARPSRSMLDGLVANLRRVSVLRDAIHQTQPDVVLSFMAHANVLTVLATTGLRSPVIVSERSSGPGGRLTRPWRVLRRLVYPRAFAMVAPTDDALRELGGARGGNGHPIPNPVAAVPMGPAVDRDAQLIVALGRLAYVKGFDLLLRAFATIAGTYPEWRLEIWGEGEERARLELLRDSLGMRDRISLPGMTRDPQSVMRRASLFVMSSRSESFGNALAEAMAAGLPVVSFDCPSGPRHIVRSGIDGLLVPPEDVRALAEAMDRLIRDEELRRQFACRGPEVARRFSMPAVLARWDAVFRAPVDDGSLLGGRLSETRPHDD